jgi:hypothetical protein
MGAASLYVIIFAVAVHACVRIRIGVIERNLEYDPGKQRSMNGNLADDELITQGQVDEGDTSYSYERGLMPVLTVLLRPVMSRTKQLKLLCKLRVIISRSLESCVLIKT